ncbi:hypothetical protein VPHK567_0135 [Vibrio phage K567]
MRHKHSVHAMMNMINYMSSQFVTGSTFLGFLPVTAANDSWGTVVPGSDHRWCAVHFFEEEQLETRSDEEETEQKRIDKGLTWLMVFYGVDNTSYMKRFKTREHLLDWWYSHDVLFSTDGLLYYNS